MPLNNLGIIQGRLLPPVDGCIQEFPIKNWKLEFNFIKALGLSHIEWIITNKSFGSNLLNLNIKKYSSRISSICCDHLINYKFNEKSFLEQKLDPVCKFALCNNIDTLTIPLLEDSSLNNSNIDLTIRNFIFFAKKYPKLKFSFEIENNAEISLCLVDRMQNFYLTYDTGNITSLGIDHKSYIEETFNKINNVHLKDRTVNPVSTVEPGKGDTDFTLILDILFKKCYKGRYTLQTARSRTGSEVATITKHIEYYEKFI